MSKKQAIDSRPKEERLIEEYTEAIGTDASKAQAAKEALKKAGLGDLATLIENKVAGQV